VCGLLIQGCGTPPTRLSLQETKADTPSGPPYERAIWATDIVQKQTPWEDGLPPKLRRLKKGELLVFVVTLPTQSESLSDESITLLHELGDETPLPSQGGRITVRAYTRWEKGRGTFSVQSYQMSPKCGKYTVVMKNSRVSVLPDYSWQFEVVE
jgi:hypothetical protein